MKVVLSGQFKRDLKLISKRKIDYEGLFDIIDYVCKYDEFPKNVIWHKLNGTMTNFSEFHFKNDLIIIFDINKTYDYLNLYRIGTHSDIFKK